MTDLKDLLDRVAPSAPGALVDPTPDLTRGRAQLQRTRRTRFALLGGAAAVAVAVPVSVGLASSGPTHSSTVATAPKPASSKPSRPSPTKPSITKIDAVQLVAYTGKQVPGYKVTEVPKGWVIQGGDDFSLDIAPKGDKDRDISSWRGKLVVMLASKDEPIPGPGKPVTINGRPGVIDTQLDDPSRPSAGGTQIVRFVGADGRGVVIQVPMTLGWDDAHLIRFGEGVEVLVNAQQGLG